MRRTALRTFLERAVLASLPLTAPACKSNAKTDMMPPTMSSDDMATASAPDDMAVATVDDMADIPTASDLFMYDLDRCETTHPNTPVNMPLSFYPDGGFLTICENGSPCTDVCPPGYMQCCAPRPSDGGTMLVTCVYNCGAGGRRPAGLEDPAASDGCVVGRYFAAAAHLEAASVHSFRVLERELKEHGAPRRLIAAARRALRDEIRHARATRRFARAHGGRPAPVRVARPAARSLEAIAVENTAEGCVRETYGALLGTWQARTAGDPAVRQMMATIAVDETRHAELAWAVDAWSRTKLDGAARRRVRAARAEAVAQLAGEIEVAPPVELVERVGLPDVERARQLFAAARRELWS
jgi:hypothetical protein